MCVRRQGCACHLVKYGPPCACSEQPLHGFHVSAHCCHMQRRPAILRIKCMLTAKRTDIALRLVRHIRLQMHICEGLLLCSAIHSQLKITQHRPLFLCK